LDIGDFTENRSLGQYVIAHVLTNPSLKQYKQQISAPHQHVTLRLSFWARAFWPLSAGYSKTVKPPRNDLD